MPKVMRSLDVTYDKFPEFPPEYKEKFLAIKYYLMGQGKTNLINKLWDIEKFMKYLLHEPKNKNEYSKAVLDRMFTAIHLATNITREQMLSDSKLDCIVRARCCFVLLWKRTLYPKMTHLAISKLMDRCDHTWTIYALKEGERMFQYDFAFSNLVGKVRDYYELSV